MPQTRGYAQQAIDRAKSDHEPDRRVHQPSLVLGMEMMLDGLSAETRALMAEDPDKGFGEHWPPVRLDDHEREVWDTAQRYLAEQLGLSLTDADAGENEGTP